MCFALVNQRNIIKGRSSACEQVSNKEYKNLMPIAIKFVPSRPKQVAVDVVPAEWQLYIAE